MGSVQRRIQKLESQVTDPSGLTPHSEEWLKHWTRKLNQFTLTGERSAIAGLRLDILDAVRERAERQRTSHSDQKVDKHGGFEPGRDTAAFTGAPAARNAVRLRCAHAEDDDGCF